MEKGNAKPDGIAGRMRKSRKGGILNKTGRLLTRCVTVLALASFMAWYVSPRPVINGPYSMAYDIERTYTATGASASFRTSDDNFFFINRILYRGEDVTERFDPEELAGLLSGCMSTRTGRLRGRDTLWELDIICRHRPVHICLGQAPYNGAGEPLYYWYESADKAHYKIQDPAAILEALESMMKPL